MSLAYNDTTNKDGLLQLIELTLGFPDAHITGDTTRLAQWTGSINLALDKVFHIIFGADGTWQFDDRNHTDYPILTTNLVASQRDYPFTTDGNSNFILDIDNVLMRTATDMPYQKVYPVDAQSHPTTRGRTHGLVDGRNIEGTPQWYDKTANGIFLDPIPNVTVTNGLKIYVRREGSYFTTSDTTKFAGFAGLYHEYLVLEPAYRYARANRLDVQETLKRDLLEMTEAITEYYGRRNRDGNHALQGREIIYE